jgi:hypothetical protein
MAVVDLVHPDVTHRIPVKRLLTQCRWFIANQELTRDPYRIPSGAAADAFQVLVAALESNPVGMNKGNSAELSQLCEEFGFDGLTAQLSMFRLSAALRDVEVRRRISGLEERWQQSERPIAELPSKLSRQAETRERGMTALKAEVAPLKEAVCGMSAQAVLPARVDRVEADIAGVASAVGELRSRVENESNRVESP